jgi:hypothetical protein
LLIRSGGDVVLGVHDEWFTAERGIYEASMAKSHAADDDAPTPCELRSTG